MANSILPRVTAWIIGLENRYRGQNLEVDLANNGINFRNLLAIDGQLLDNNVSANYNASKANFFMHRQLSLEEIGCSLSHIAAVKFFLDSEDDFALVLEDDMRIMGSFEIDAEITRTLACEIPRIIQCYIFPYDDYFPFAQNTKIENFQVKPIRFAARGACAYILNRAAAKAILNHGEIIYSVADWPIWQLEIDWFLLINSPFHHINSPSNPSTIEVSRREIDKSKTFLWTSTYRFIRICFAVIGARALYGFFRFRISIAKLFVYEVIRPIYLKFLL